MFIFVSMNNIAIILSLYILSLNFATCDDVAVADNDIKTEILQDIDNDLNHLGLDSCTPFCSCQCCHIHVTKFQISNFSSVDPQVFSKIFYYQDRVKKDFSSTLLQPPRV